MRDGRPRCWQCLRRMRWVAAINLWVCRTCSAAEAGEHLAVREGYRSWRD